MSRYSLTTEAQNDLREIREYLLQRAGVRVTRRVISSLIAAFRSLARTPGLGHRREDLTTHDFVSGLCFRIGLFIEKIQHRSGSSPFLMADET